MYNKENLNKIPKNPGVYLMKDKQDNILYIGKAKNLNSRVKQYFIDENVKKRGPKIEKMVTLIDDIEYIITNNEVEALVLENNLIKEHMPKYNTLLKDNKTYPYIKVTNEEYPRILFSRKIEKDNAKYFGPYVDVTAINNVIDSLKDIYKIRYCDTTNLPKTKCMYYEIKRCDGPCICDCKDKYQENIKKIIEILSGNNAEVLKELKEKMMKYSDEMDFEMAIKYRELIKSFERINLKQNINNQFDSQDIIAYERIENRAIVVIFFIRDGKLVNRDYFYLENVENDILSSFIKQYYSNIIYFPKEIIISEDIEDKELLQEWINEKVKGVKILIPQKGQKNKLIELATQNAKVLANEEIQKIKSKQDKLSEELKEISNIIGVEELKRMESFDISNTAGVLNVASMVVFEDGNFKKNSYRKFRLNTVGADDYECMKEVITRRFTDDKMKFYPTVLLIDGGKGQVNIVENVLKDLNIDIPVCGMVKDDNHRTRGLFYQNKEYSIKKSINLITRIQDETHRFAVSYHSLLRSKEMLHSILDDIPGIGKKKKNILLEHFKSVENISNAQKEDFLNIKGINDKDIDNIIKFFKEIKDKTKENGY